ncbi:MAG: N-acetylmuramoyl-L-alanine amidase [Kangiellaceae bacterium]|jgi:N-acetylmuramoyl-L-alanine amidase|nr:N-acetylmuramoyl-L-alanine amidase [Kangiellaceae bacterium]
MIRIIIFSWLLVSATLANAVQVKGLRFWQSPDSTRVVLDLSKSTKHNVFSLDDPDRMVIDITDGQLGFDTADLDVKSEIIKHVRASKNNKGVRIVLDLKYAATFKSFQLKPYQNYGHRLVVDLMSSKKKSAPPKPRAIAKAINRDIVVAIDAGHGGEDPGALGNKGTKEKVIALKVAKQLAGMINKEPGMKAVMVRNGDYFVSLRKRTAIARQNQADIFVSIHADGFHDKRANGASVWVVSPKGAKSEMGRWLEQSENESDLLGGVESISDKDPLLAEVLLDLSTTYSVSASIDAANLVHKYLAKSAPKMHKKRVERAGFVVLKMPDIPAMLVELAFISNPKEERLLNTFNHRKKLASAIFSGLKNYFKQNPPDGTLYANRNPSHYTIKGGDTLSTIAQRFDVRLADLKKVNKIKSDNIRVGQRLKIPN